VTPACDADALSDQLWFDQHPRRRYRARAGWLIRRRGAAMLRTRTPAQPLPDDDAALRVAWVGAAHPDLNAIERVALVKAIRAMEPRR
jgi:hypothetical protein